MSYKDLIGKNNKLLSNVTATDLANDSESEDYLSDYFRKETRFIPPIDFASASNFARFGSAEKYFVDAIDRIYNTYPYDGSLKERIQWENSSSYLDLYIFENEYPRQNGFISISADGWGTQAATTAGYGSPSTQEYINIKGGPNTSKRPKGRDIRDESGNYQDGYANTYDFAENRESNLKIDGVDGNTVEFWLKKEEFLTSLTHKEVLFDVHTEAFISSSINYGRLRIEMSGHGAGGGDDAETSPFYVTYMSGANGFCTASIGQNITTASIADNEWHHYAFVFANTGSNVKAKLYIDGECNHTIHGSATTLNADASATNVNYVSGNLMATIGALTVSPSGTVASMKGWGKLSGSLDEFRFWKKARNSQQVNRQIIEPVGGGANTDTSNTSLGVYYKFNEGITGDTTLDQNIIDYSGRISNGVYVGYNTSVRSLNSAIVESGKASFEFKDPILYPTHPDLIAYRQDKRNEGIEYDYTNNAALYHTLPAWIIEEQEDKEYIETPLRNLTQIIGSYFDTLSNDIEALSSLKHKTYPSASAKPYPFANRLLEAAGFTSMGDLFADASTLAHYRNRSEYQMFKQKLYDVKNTIYQNIYNNIVYIFKSKGTEKSFRNLIRCYGVDDEIYRINAYAQNGTYALDDNFRTVTERKKYINFGLTGTAGATVYPHSASDNSNSTSYIRGLTKGDGFALTMEAEAVFPKRFTLGDINVVRSGSTDILRAYNEVVTASLFGMHRKHDTTENAMIWHATDNSNFQVAALKEDAYSARCRFRLTGTAGGFIHPELTSSYFEDVFDDNKWNFSVTIKPSAYPEADLVDGTTGSASDYIVEFYGANNVLDDTKHEFLVTGTLSRTAGLNFLENNKSIYMGAHRTNWSGSLLERSDANISSTRVWLTSLSTGTIKQHASDARNYGVPAPQRSAYLFQSTMTSSHVPEIHTLALNWNFDTVTSSNASGQFFAADFSSGSSRFVDRYGDIGNITGKQYLPKGDLFPASFSGSVNKKYIYSAKKQLPEVVTSGDMVQVVDMDDVTFTRETRPVNYYMAIEKSMYQAISQEIINMFSSVKDFNNLIGDPVNKYRPNYKRMEKLRQLFFERVGNTPDLDKYVDYYIWLDSALDDVLRQLIPASADDYEHETLIKTMVESHVLERNKYQFQYPTFEDNTPDPSGRILGINELTYNWKFGHAPVGEPPTSQNENCLWWKERAERTIPAISASNPNTEPGANSDRDDLLEAITTEASASAPILAKSASSGITTYQGSTFALRKLVKPYRIEINEAKGLHGGVNFNRNKKLDYANPLFRQFVSDDGTAPGLKTLSTSFESGSCADDSTLNLKPSVDFKVKSPAYSVKDSNDPYLDGTGELIAPFNIVSSSVELTAMAEVNVVNLHHDTYGYDKEVPLQSPFTEKYVGGKAYRHTWNNFDPNSNNMEDRAEGWRIIDSSTVLSMSAPNFSTDAAIDQNLARSVFYRDETAKRPVNIRNIQQVTGTALGGDFTVIGNYTHDYEILNTSGRSINNRYLVEVDGLSGSAVNSAVINGLIDYGLPTREISGANKFIFVNRFNSPGGPAASAIGTMDFEAAEYSVYNALPYRNLAVRTALDELYTDHCKQFGYFSDMQNSASWNRAILQDIKDVGDYPGTSGSVNTGSYYETAGYIDATASFHKVHRNTRKSIRYSNEYTEHSHLGATETASIHDNWFCQRPIPQTDIQYAWITASLVNTYSGSGLFGYEQPDWKNASLASTDLTFASSSDFGTFQALSTRRWFGAAVVEGGDRFLQTDFVGMNYNIYEPVSSSDNFLGYTELNIWRPIPAAAQWTSNYFGGFSFKTSFVNQGYLWPITAEPSMRGAAALLNGILSHRQGPYGAANWKLYRKDNHPIVRVHRKENRFSFMKTIASPQIGKRQQNVATSQIEPPITSKFKPLRHNLMIKTTAGENAPSASTYIQHTYGNELAYFTSHVPGFADLNNDSSINFFSRKKKELMYDSLNTLIMPSTLYNTAVNPISKFLSVQVAETIYPREKYTYLKKVRQRSEFVPKTFRELRADRTQTDPVNSQGYTVPLQSMWAMDGGTASIRNRDDEPGLQKEGDGAGELQNNYVTYYTASGGTDALGRALTGSATGGWIIPGACYTQAVSCSLPGTGAINDVAWTVGEDAGINPYVTAASKEAQKGNTHYEKFAHDIKYMGKDFGIIPEFRASEHMNFWIMEKGGDFLANVTGAFTLTGSSISSSTEPDFYKVFGNSDFMKIFQRVEDDYTEDDFARPSKLTLKCNAIMKFLPYEGFYPAQRTLQLATMFSQSYAPSNLSISNAADNAAASSSMRALLTPFYAPGIMYNSIKAGIAMDYPVFTSSFAHNTGDGGGIWDEVSYRMPFEAIVDPTAYPIGTDGKIYDMPSTSTSILLNQSGSSGQKPYIKLLEEDTPLYKLASSNFFGECINFFLPQNRMTSFMSLPSSDPNFGLAQPGATTYKMDIFLSDNKQLLRAGAGAEEKTFANYLDRTAWGAQFRGWDGYNYAAAWYPYMAPYMTDAPNDNVAGYCRIQMEFTPPTDLPAAKYGIDDIFDTGSMTMTFSRAAAWTQRSATSGQGGWSNAAGSQCVAQMSSSISIKRARVKRVGYNAATKTAISVTDDAGAELDVFLVEPKFETPMANFLNVAATGTTHNPGENTSGWTNSGFVRKGMWHQLGDYNEQEGLYMAVVPRSGERSGEETGDLAELLGMTKTSNSLTKRLGKVALTKEISEAVVAIPFFTETIPGRGSVKKYFQIPDLTVEFAKLEANGDTETLNNLLERDNNKIAKPGQGIVDMIKKMKNYVLPPSFDFLNFDVDPIAMFIFEFKHKLNQDDLLNIWQNTAPSSIANTAQIQDAEVTIDILDAGPDGYSPDGVELLGKLPPTTQWLVFKAKKRATHNYFDKTSDLDDGGDFKFKFAFQEGDSGVPPVSYNWPYDFFSLVELVKIDTDITLDSGKVEMVGATQEQVNAIMTGMSLLADEESDPPAKSETSDGAALLKIFKLDGE